jgi:3-oxoacyl-[acyl-carrier-protein] synthase III
MLLKRSVMSAPSIGSISAGISAVFTHLPRQVLTNDALAAVFPDWPAQRIFDKTGILERRIAAADETAADLAYEAARKLFEAGGTVAEEVDFLILCTQAPDYILPTSACLLQERLGLRRNIGALDINLGCSGFVYGLSLATGLIASGAATNILLLTADTYSKYIHEGDKSVRTLFGDGAAATLITAHARETSKIGPFIYGTDGRGGRDLIVEAGGFRRPRNAATAIVRDDGAGNSRAAENLFMNGANVMSFSLREVPRTYEALLEKAGWTPADVDYVVLHQANKFMLDALQKKLSLPDAKCPRHYEDIGNTVSSTIPFVLSELLCDGSLTSGTRLILIGFGVGLSWAGASLVW